MIRCENCQGDMKKLGRLDGADPELFPFRDLQDRRIAWCPICGAIQEYINSPNTEFQIGNPRIPSRWPLGRL